MTRAAFAALLLCACGAGPLAPDDPALATARFRVEMLQPGRYHELELRCADGRAAMIWSTVRDQGRSGTTRLDLRREGLADIEFTVDPAAQQAVCFGDGRPLYTQTVLMLRGVSTRLRL